MEKQTILPRNSIPSLKKIQRFTQNATNLQLFPNNKKKKNVSKKTKALSDKKLFEHLQQGHDAFLEEYIKKHELSTALQQYLIRAHKIKLISIYIEYYGFCQEAQQEFVDFMKDKLLR